MKIFSGETWLFVLILRLVDFLQICFDLTKAQQKKSVEAVWKC